ncbi:uncharacterized protein LOC122715930 [Apis laboriosa]|uniref:uncharacterized protein LOC122715930 n=1 Tax=Apis laboriosa TaxID=183418 RepID=UPI001CC611C4|nr:uncharacterized protein LOC122715930 [Apis laboriosa]
MSRGSPWCWDAPGTRKSMLFLTIAILFGLLSRGIVGEINKKYHISDVCKNNYMRDLYRKIDGAVLQSQLEKDLDCTITFQTHSILQRFMLRFDHLQLDCNDHLYIYDGAHAVSSYKADLSCQNTKQTVGAIYTRTNFVTLKYVTDSWGTLSNGFRLVITAVKDPKHTCKDFRCTQNEFCIERDLLCDGVNHCGDESDEATSTLCANSEASTILGMQTIWFVIALVFLILSVAGLVTAAVLCFCRQRAATPRHPHNAHNAQTHPPVSFPYGASSSSSPPSIDSAQIDRLQTSKKKGKGGKKGNTGNTCTEYGKRSNSNTSSSSCSSSSSSSSWIGSTLAETSDRGEGGACIDRRVPPTIDMAARGKAVGRFLLALALLLAVSSSSASIIPPSGESRPLAIGNTLEQGKDYFIGPCLVNTNQTCPDKEVTFFLYTKRNPKTWQRISVDGSGSNLRRTNFNGSNPTKIVVHGYDSDMELSYLVDVRDEYLKRYDYNVIAVDWHRLATAPCYPIAVQNVPHVGDCLAQLVERLRDEGAVDVHVIGFSLGAHVPAFAANALSPYKMSRITGLDPAMPLFVTVDKRDKLDASDAHFVDVFHTNAFIQGKVEMSGHIDFYMNGGINQPGCWEGWRPFECDHHRSVMYFAESINTDVGFWGWQCGGFALYLLGLCPPRYPAVLAGDKVDTRRRGFHLVRTNAYSPYAMGNFSVNRLDVYTL